MNPSVIAMSVSIATLLQVPPEAYPSEASFHLLALIFYMDHIQLTSSATCTQFNSLQEFLSTFESYVASCPLSMNNHHSKLIASDLESLIDFFQQLEYSCFSSTENPVEVSNLLGPNCLAKESLFGYFIRNVIAQWEMLEFNQLCDAFTAYQHFCQSPSSATINSIAQQTTDDGTFSSDLTRALHRGDVHQAMELSHARYDQYDQSPKNLQHAILCQSLIYIHGANYSSAKIALEEVIKIAHSRNDHESIAKAMELLFHVTRNSETIEKRRYSSAEELLFTCTEKNVQLKLPGAAAKCSFFLLTSRCNNHRPLSHPEESLSLDWTTLHVALLGDSRLLLGLIRRLSDEESLQSAYTVSDVAMSKADRPLTLTEADDLCPYFYPACMAFWQAQGREPLAIQSGVRFLHRVSMGVPCDLDSLLDIVLRIARMRARSTCLYFHSQHERRLCRLAPAEELMRAASELASWAGIHLLRVLRFSELYVRGVSLLEKEESTLSRVTALALTEPLMLAQLASDEIYFEARTLSALLLHRSSEEALRRELASVAMEARTAGLSSVHEEVQRLCFNLTDDKLL